jgi:hypothetical protein
MQKKRKEKKKGMPWPLKSDNGLHVKASFMHRK